MITASAGTICSEPATISAGDGLWRPVRPFRYAPFLRRCFAVAVHFNTQRLDVEFELNTSSRAFFTSRREPGMFSSSRDRHRLRASLPGVQTCARSPSGIATAKYYHAFTFHADERFALVSPKPINCLVLAMRNGSARTRHQRLRFPARRALTDKSRAKEHGIVITQQIVQLYVAAPSVLSLNSIPMPVKISRRRVLPLFPV